MQQNSAIELDEQDEIESQHGMDECGDNDERYEHDELDSLDILEVQMRELLYNS